MDNINGVARYAVSFPLTKPVPMKRLTDDEQRALKQHGCKIEPFFETRPDLNNGHWVTFPSGTELEEITTAYYIIRFSDGRYAPTLTWTEGWYHFSQVPSGNGHLV